MIGLVGIGVLNRKPLPLRAMPAQSGYPAVCRSLVRTADILLVFAKICVEEFIAPVDRHVVCSECDVWVLCWRDRGESLSPVDKDGVTI